MNIKYQIVRFWMLWEIFFIDMASFCHRRYEKWLEKMRVIREAETRCDGAENEHNTKTRVEDVRQHIR